MSLRSQLQISGLSGPWGSCIGYIESQMLNLKKKKKTVLATLQKVPPALDALASLAYINQELLINLAPGKLRVLLFPQRALLTLSGALTAECVG